MFRRQTQLSQFWILSEDTLYPFKANILLKQMLEVVPISIFSTHFRTSNANHQMLVPPGPIQLNIYWSQIIFLQNACIYLDTYYKMCFVLLKNVNQVLQNN